MISVGICTWNRARLLRRTLESLAAVTPPKSDWEIVVVDNNCTDETQEVLTEFASLLPLTVGEQSIQGHAASRNRVIELAKGDYLAWTDDDVVVSQSWLVNYEKAFLSNPHATFFGGVIEPEFEVERPDWLVETWAKCKCAYALRDLGDKVLEFDDACLPYGANFAVKMEVQRAFLYDLATGRKGEGVLGEDEIVVMRRMLREGHRGIWCPDVSLKHILPKERLSESYLRRYFFGQGRANVLYGKVSRRKYCAAMDGLWSELMYRLKRQRVHPDEWVSHMIRASLSWGEWNQKNPAENSVTTQ